MVLIRECVGKRSRVLRMNSGYCDIYSLRRSVRINKGWVRCKIRRVPFQEASFGWYFEKESWQLGQMQPIGQKNQDLEHIMGSDKGMRIWCLERALLVE